MLMLFLLSFFELSASFVEFHFTWLGESHGDSEAASGMGRDKGENIAFVH